MVTKLIGPFGLVGPSRSRYDTNSNTDLGVAVEITAVPSWVEVRYPDDVGSGFGDQVEIRRVRAEEVRRGERYGHFYHMPYRVLLEVLAV